MLRTLVDVSIVIIGLSIVFPFVLGLLVLVVHLILWLFQSTHNYRIVTYPILVGLTTYLLSENSLITLGLSLICFLILDSQRKSKKAVLIEPTVEYQEAQIVDLPKPTKRKRIGTKKA